MLDHTAWYDLTACADEKRKHLNCWGTQCSGGSDAEISIGSIEKKDKLMHLVLVGTTLKVLLLQIGEGLKTDQQISLTAKKKKIRKTRLKSITSNFQSCKKSEDIYSLESFFLILSSLSFISAALSTLMESEQSKLHRCRTPAFPPMIYPAGVWHTVQRRCKNSCLWLTPIILYTVYTFQTFLLIHHLPDWRETFARF